MLALTPTDHPAETIMPPIDRGHRGTHVALHSEYKLGEISVSCRRNTGRGFQRKSSESCHMLNKPFNSAALCHKPSPPCYPQNERMPVVQLCVCLTYIYVVISSWLPFIISRPVERIKPTTN